MTEYHTHTWPSVVSRFRELANATPAFVPLADAVEQLAASPFASGLHPVASMHTLQLYQLDRFDLGDEHLRLDLEEGTFVLRHLPRGTPDPRLSFSSPAGVWTKNGPDALPLLARAFDHLKWLIEYRGTDPTS